MQDRPTGSVFETFLCPSHGPADRSCRAFVLDANVGDAGGPSVFCERGAWPPTRAWVAYPGTGLLDDPRDRDAVELPAVRPLVEAAGVQVLVNEEIGCTLLVLFDLPPQ